MGKPEVTDPNRFERRAAETLPCEGLDGCVLLEGVIYDMYSHDNRCQARLRFTVATALATTDQEAEARGYAKGVQDSAKVVESYEKPGSYLMPISVAIRTLPVERKINGHNNADSDPETGGSLSGS